MGLSVGRVHSPWRALDFVVDPETAVPGVHVRAACFTPMCAFGLGCSSITMPAGVHVETWVCDMCHIPRLAGHQTFRGCFNT